MHRTEDIYHCLSWQIRLGYADDATFHETDFININTTLQASPLFTDKHIINTRFTNRSTWGTDSNTRENIITQFNLNYFWLHNANQRTAVIMQRIIGRSMTLDQLLTQGGNQRLRGYPQFYQIGN